MTVETPWGYTVEELSHVISVDDFRALCPGLSSTDGQIEAVLDAVSSAVRDYCGWHVSPVLQCTFTGSGEGRLLVLPGMGVSSVDSLTVGGVAVNDYEWAGSGLVRLTCGYFPDSWRSVTCVYNAGFDSGSVAQVVSQIAANALVAAPGVANERAGNVSITYNQTGSGITGGVSLLQRDRELLAPYVLMQAR
jgi:hypothetical protein